MKTPARIALEAGFDPLEVWPFQDEDRHFCSGVNSPGEVKGLQLSGRSIGITCTEIRAGLLEQLELGCSRVFVDSGAFSEVKFCPAGRTVVKPITDADWLARFETYRTVAQISGPRAFIVAPDAVGDQRETLKRLERWAHVVRGLALHYRVNVIVPVQNGELAPIDFLTQALAILRLPKDQIVIGIPSRKSATSPAELEALAAALAECGVVAPFHLLGMGPKSKGWGPMRDAIRAHLPGAIIYSDSVAIRAEVGRTNGPKGTPRRITAAQDRARARGVTGTEIKAEALIETGHDDMRTAAQAARRAGWYDPELESAPGVPFLNDDGEPCLGYGPGGPFGESEPAQLELEVAA